MSSFEVLFWVVCGSVVRGGLATIRAYLLANVKYLSEVVVLKFESITYQFMSYNSPMNTSMQTKRNIYLWLLYDFANSIISIVFFLYFAQWVVIERGIPDIWFNLTFTASAILLLLTVPVTGFVLDRHLRRITGLRFCSVFMALFYIASVFSAVAQNETSALVFFTLGLYVYLLTFTFYTPLLTDISTPEKVGKISGLGIAANYAGQFVGLLIALPFSKGIFSLFDPSKGVSVRVETLLPSIIAFCIFAIPMLIWFKEPKKVRDPNAPAVLIKEETKELWKQTKALFLFPGIALFILAYFLFNDAILTASNNFPIFMEQIWHVDDTVKTYLLLGIIVTTAVGGYVSGVMADKYGHKRTLMFVIVGWIFLLPIIGFIRNFPIFVIAAIVMGFWFGSNWAVSRSVMSYLAPPGGHNLAFAYFGLVERASSFVGPIVWGVVVSTGMHMGSDRYRYAILAVTVFILLGFLVLKRVRDDRFI